MVEQHLCIAIFPRKQLKQQTQTAVPKNRSPFEEAIVFVIGGGNYVEYENLRAWGGRQVPTKNIVYGCTELVNAEEFLEQLNELGKQ